MNPQSPVLDLRAQRPFLALWWYVNSHSLPLKVFVHSYWPVCCDLITQEEVRLSAIFDRALNFMANSSSLRDVLVSLCWSHIWHLLKWKHTRTHTHIHKTHMSVCDLDEQRWRVRLFRAFLLVLVDLITEVLVTAYILFIIWFYVDVTALKALQHHTVITVCTVWPGQTQVMFV